MVIALTMHAETLLPRKQLDTCLTTQISQLMFWFFLLCLSIMLFLFLLNSHYLNPSFYFLLVPQEMGVSKMLGWSLAVGCPSNWTILWYFLLCLSHIYYRCQKALHNAVRKKFLVKILDCPKFSQVFFVFFGFFYVKFWQIQYWPISQESHRSIATSQESIHFSSYTSHQHSLKSERETVLRKMEQNWEERLDDTPHSKLLCGYVWILTYFKNLKHFYCCGSSQKIAEQLL